MVGIEDQRAELDGFRAGPADTSLWTLPPERLSLPIVFAATRTSRGSAAGPVDCE
ncbi:hypothetical protein MOX02_47630 [Methylobacterium oxalidis]|uniref:Uncharacterized protein n=1 Tax=Methylobacterium oxalidis TaxID=944322 RepID=A0A512J9X1_9HYPH|nr:hypothetical protein MOX02_47630 [Methylobacterium oxalidis]GLS64734.1 hypothetical protein GCM10007888_31150 [Methylobacterium oxalidis]